MPSLAALEPAPNALPLRRGGPATQAAGDVRLVSRPSLGVDRTELTAADPLETGTTRVLTALRSAGVDPDSLKAVDVRGLGGLVGAGLVSPSALASLAGRIAADPTTLSRTLSERRAAYMARIAERHGVSLRDGSSRWTVQEIANLDWVLSQLPASFKRIVQEGGPIEREVASDSYSGLYDPFKDRISFPDNVNSGGLTLASVQRSERFMRSVMVHEMAHAWQIRQTSVVNPGIGGVLKALRGIAVREHDVVSDWSAIAGWTVRAKWSVRDWLGKPHLPNSSNASHVLAGLELGAFGRNRTLNLTNLRLDPAREGAMISDYAKTDPYEDFAESVAAYVVDSAEIKRRSPEKYAYIRDRMMGGREFANRYGIY